jgi:chorismate dehydratase
MKLRVALVSYINTRPFTDGLQSVFGPDEIELQLRPPADCGIALRDGLCDLALVPCGSLVDFQNIGLMNDHCIGADGAVDSVFIFSQSPITECDRLLLDEHSRTSNGLARILLREFWKHPLPEEMPQTRDFSGIEGKSAGVAIGDRAYQMKGKFKYVYDLAGMWKEWTGLPFVFAVWAYHRDRVTAAQLERVREGLEAGRRGRKESAGRWAAEYGYTVEQAEKYLCESISFTMDAAKHEAFGRYMGELLKG